MAEMPKPRLAIYVALAIAVLLIGSRFLRGSSDDAGGAGGAMATQTTGSGGAGSGGGAGGASASARGAASSGSGAAGGGTAAAGAGGAPEGLSASGGEAGLDGQLVVDVKGAVRRPGVYRLATGARALDAVRRAGGMTGRAERLGVNLAARVTDGGEVVVPARGPGSGAARSTAGAGAGGAGAAGAGGAAGAAGAGGPISLDLNTATAVQLEQLDGVGPATAAKIVAYREQHGGIGSVDELDEVSGIGEKRLAAIRAQLGP
jgi:competence protein ComEA